MLTDGQTHRDRYLNPQTDRHAHYNTPLPYQQQSDRAMEDSRFHPRQQFNTTVIGGLGSALISSHSGSGQSPAAKRYLVNFRLKISPLVGLATIFRSFSGNETSNLGGLGGQVVTYLNCFLTAMLATITSVCDDAQNISKSAEKNCGARCMTFPSFQSPFSRLPPPLRSRTLKSS